MTTYLTDNSLTKSLTTTNSARLKPIVYGGALAGVGYLLLKAKPAFGEMPETHVSKRKRRSKASKAARFARDGAKTLAPGNLTDKMGKSLLIGGIAMVAARLLDEAS